MSHNKGYYTQKKMNEDLVNMEESPLDFKFEDFLDYKRIIEEYSHNNSERLFLNESCIHAAMVTKEIFNRATNNCVDVDMFCGEFSLFRESFKTRINEIKKQMEPEIKVGLKVDFEAFDPYKDLIESLKKFFDKDLHLNVIIAKPIDNIKNDDNCGFFKEKMNQGLLSFRLLDIDLGLDHFIVSGDAFRKENSGKKRTATCSFNRHEYADMFRQTFENLKSFSSIYSF